MFEDIIDFPDPPIVVDDEEEEKENKFLGVRQVIEKWKATGRGEWIYTSNFNRWINL